MRIAILGRTHLLYDSVRPLIEAGHDIACILTCGEAPEYSRSAVDFENLAAELNVPFLATDRLNDENVISWVRDKRPDIGASINWRTIIGTRFRNLFKHGIINVHLGDLPRYRGNATANWAILNGEKETMLTLHLMSNSLDAGPILLKEPIPITDETYIGDILESAAKLTPTMLIQAVDGLTDGRLTPEPQPDDPRLALRCYPRLPVDSEIDWRTPADQIARLVRGSAEPFGGTYTYLNRDKLTIWRAHAEKPRTPILGIPGQVAEVRRTNGEVAIITGDGFLVATEIELDDGGRNVASDIITSSRTRLGMDMAAEVIRLQTLLKEMNHREKELVE